LRVNLDNIPQHHHNRKEMSTQSRSWWEDSDWFTPNTCPPSIPPPPFPSET
jgi:hypothetical protein